MLFRNTNLSFFLFLQWLIQFSAAFNGNGLAASLRDRSTVRRCVVPAKNDDTDDSPAILAAFRDCKRDSDIVFQNTTYNIAQVMNVTGLENVKIELHGTMLWSKDIQYWLENYLPIGPGHDQSSYPPAAYQNQTTAFILSGKGLYV